MKKIKIWGKDIIGWMFISPWVIGFIAFTVGPMIFAFIMSLTNWSMLKEPSFIGLANYIKIFTDDPLFWKAIKVTLIYTFVSLPLTMAGGLGLAMLLNRNIKGLSWLRAVYYLPLVIPSIASAIMWKWMLSPDYGVVNTLLRVYMHITGPRWFYDTSWALPSFIIMSLWGIGGNMVIYLAGLQGIPDVFYEAADIDGVNAWQRFRYITVPMLSPTIFFTMIMGVIGSFQLFDTAFLITEGGPNHATLFYMLYLYRMGFKSFKMGYASALAWILFVVVIVITIIQFRLSRKWVYYEYEE
ncbi:MAG: sugar ABC transporter permease [Actinobacteria bacterium]|nr:sugar ABC transporter permease [Actinomycetota bacterium]